MTLIDNVLKMLISSFSEAFAAWLLGSPPRQVQPLSVELPASAMLGDLVFRVFQADGTTVLLHIELQGRGSREPMPWRMLDYMTRLARRELADRPPADWAQLYSVVIYIGPGVGANDPGQYEIMGPDGVHSLSWRYKPILLWQMEAEELLALEEPAFLALIGQTRLREPERVIPEAVARIQQVEDEIQRGRLLTALASLSGEEVMEVVERLLDPLDEYLLELPYQQRLLQIGREEGRAEGIAKGRGEGLAEGVAKGREEGMLAGLREAIQEVIAERFNPPTKEYRQVSRQLEGVARGDVLRRLLSTAIQAEDMATFTSRLADELPKEEPASP